MLVFEAADNASFHLPFVPLPGSDFLHTPLFMAVLTIWDVKLQAPQDLLQFQFKGLTDTGLTASFPGVIYSCFEAPYLCGRVRVNTHSWAAVSFVTSLSTGKTRQGHSICLEEPQPLIPETLHSLVYIPLIASMSTHTAFSDTLSFILHNKLLMHTHAGFAILQMSYGAFIK